MAGPKEFQKWLIVNTSTVKSLVWGGGSTAQDTVDFLNDAISSSGWTSGPLYYKDDNGECYINTGDQQPTNPGIIGITTGNASTSNICVTRNDQDWYGWRIIEEGDPCDVSVQTQSFTTETSGATVNDQREGSYDHWVAMGSPSPNDILQYTSTINGVTAQRCWIFEYTGSVLPNGGATFTEPLPGQFPPNLGDATTNCDVCATNLFEDIQYHVWEVCGSGFSEPLLNTSIFNNIPAGGYPTNNDDVEALMALPHGGTLVIGDVSQYDGICYEYRGLDSISNGQYQTWSGLPDLGLTAATAHGDCNNCMNPSTTDDYWHNWKRHSTCGTNPVETSITNAASNASLSAKRQGSHDFWVAMGEPNVGQFITYGPPGSDPQCWEYMGYDPSGNMAPGSMVDYIQEPTPALTGADQFNDCTTCYIDLTGGQLYHLFSNCDNPSDTFIGLTSSTTVDVAENNALYTAFSNPSPGQYFQWENSFQELKCIKYEGQGTAGQATSLPVAMNHITGPVNVGTFFNECNACLTPPGNYHKWMKCGSTEVVNIVSVGSNNDPTENGNFWASVGNPLQNKIVDFDSGAGRSDDCYEYLGTSASAESGLEFKNIGTAQIYNDCATCSVIPVPGCMDPLASNYNPAATVDDGSCTFAAGCTDPAADNYNPNATVDDGTCLYCVYGCTDATASNYNASATCDDGSCSVVQGGTGCTIAFGPEECQPDGTSSVEIDLSEGGGLSNVIYNVGQGRGKGEDSGAGTNTSTGCNPPTSIPITGLVEGDTISVLGECSYAKEDYNFSLGGNKPEWANESCGEETSTTTTFSADTTVYVWYDTSSWGGNAIIAAYNAVIDWLDDQALNNGWTGDVYHILAQNERFVNWASYPMTGNIELTGGNDFTSCSQSSSSSWGVSSNFAVAAGWITHNNIPNWYHTVNLELYGSGSITVNKDADGNPTATTTYTKAQIDAASCMSNTGYIGPSTFAGEGNNGLGAMPPQMPAGGNFLNLIFLDESTDYNTGSTNNTQYGNPSGSGGYTSSSTTNQDTHSTYKAELQVKPNYMLDYDSYVTAWKIWDAGTGTGRTFLYPTYPQVGGTGVTNQHYGMPQLAGGMILSGNKTTPDGHWLDGTANTEYPVLAGSDFGKITFFEDGTQGQRHNVFWDKPNATHPAYGYGGLDNYGWGTNVEMEPSGFTAQTFENDLATFLTSGPPIVTNTTTCTDQQCIFIKAVDENGAPIVGYPITLNGVSIGTTNAVGIASHILTGPGPAIVNDCYTFTAVGGCVQTLVTITVTEAEYTAVLNCILGCTDPNSWNYNPLAGIDDGSCMFPLEEDPRDSMSRCELLKIDTECQFATDIYNIYKHDRFGFERNCLNNIEGHINAKYSSDWVDRLLPDYGAETFTKKQHTKGATPKPDWVVSACGEASKDLTLYFMYDTTSLSQQKVTAARNAVEEWVDEVRTTRAATALSMGDEEACQNSDDAGTITVYHTLVAGERWLDWGIFPMTGRFNNFGQYDNSGDSDFRYCGGYDSLSGQNLTGEGLIDAVIPETTTNCHFWSTLIYDSPTRLWYNAGGTTYTCTSCDGHHTASGYNGQVYSGTLNGEPPIPTTDNVLVVAFEDEAASGGSSPATNYHYVNSSSTPSWRYAMDGSTGNSAANGVDTATGHRCSTCYMNDYNKFIEVYLSWTGVSADRKIDLFLYPSAPTSVSGTGAHYLFPLHALGAIHSGDSTPRDGQLATAPTNSLATLSAITSANPYYTAQNTVTNHVANGKVDSGYGGLDQYGWGLNVAEAAFTKAGFVSDLSAFWSTEACNDAECILIRVEDKEGTPIPNYEINLDGIVIGETDDFGVLRTCIENASINTDHKINLCHCFYTTGGCNQQKLKIVVEGLDCDDCGNIKMFK